MQTGVAFFGNLRSLADFDAHGHLSLPGLFKHRDDVLMTGIRL
jgi:hypothetical protein